jgi:hypothetical protein
MSGDDIALSELRDGGMLAGHVGEEAVLLARRGTHGGRSTTGACLRGRETYPGNR